MKKSKNVKGVKAISGILTVLLLLSNISCAVPPEPRFEANPGAFRTALVRGKIKEALASYESQALEAEKTARLSLWPIQDLATASQAYRLASGAAFYSGQLQKAITYGAKALEMAEEIKGVVPNTGRPVGADQLPRIKVEAILDLIQAYRSVRNYERARELIEKGLTIAKDIVPEPPKSDMKANLYFNLGVVLMNGRQYEEAADAFSQSFYLQRDSFVGALRKLIPSRQIRAITTVSFLGKAYLEAGKFAAAMEQYQQAFGLAKEWNVRYPFVADLYEGVGEIFFRQRDLSQAMENFGKAMSIAEGQQRSPLISSLSRRIGDILKLTGKAGGAIPHYQKAIQQIEYARSLLESEEYRQSYFEGQLDAYVKMIDALLLSGNEEEAFNYNERARSRVLLDILGSKVQLSRLKSGLLEEEKDLQERIAALRARSLGEEGSQRENLRKELAEAEQAYNAFLSRVRKQDKEQASLMSVEPLALKEVQALLDTGTTLVEYLVTEREIFVWVVEKGKLQFQRVPLPKEDLTKLVKTLRESIFSLGEKNKFNEVSASLYKHLIQPLLPHIGGKELIIVPHDVLHYLPFHALLSPEGKYLIESYPVYYLSSASLLQFTREKRRARGEKVLAFGNPDLGDPAMDLRFAELEAREIRKIYPQGTVFLRKEASEEKGKSLSPQHDILHFATHAELSEEDPLSSAILLAKDGKEDGRLEVREIFGMDLKANLVVLSACETGLGKLSTGDELVGLTRAFIYAGTPSVVASLWKVEDDTTATLMASFYRNLRTMSKVEALREAQLQLIRGEGRSDLLARRGVGGIGKLGEVPEAKPQSPTPVPVSISTSHPYFWAPFILVGDGN